IEPEGNRGCPIDLAVLPQAADVLKVKRLPVEGGVMRIDGDTEIGFRLGGIDDQHPDQSQEDWDSRWLVLTIHGQRRNLRQITPRVPKPPELIRVDLLHWETERRIGDECHRPHDATAGPGYKHPCCREGIVKAQAPAGRMGIHVAVSHVLVVLETEGLLESVTIGGKTEVESICERIVLEPGSFEP